MSQKVHFFCFCLYCKRKENGIKSALLRSWNWINIDILLNNDFNNSLTDSSGKDLKNWSSLSAVGTTIGTWTLEKKTKKLIKRHLNNDNKVSDGWNKKCTRVGFISLSCRTEDEFAYFYLHIFYLLFFSHTCQINTWQTSVLLTLWRCFCRFVCTVVFCHWWLSRTWRQCDTHTHTHRHTHTHTHLANKITVQQNHLACKTLYDLRETPAGRRVFTCFSILRGSEQVFCAACQHAVLLCMFMFNVFMSAFFYFKVPPNYNDGKKSS